MFKLRFVFIGLALGSNMTLAEDGQLTVTTQSMALNPVVVQCVDLLQAGKVYLPNGPVKFDLVNTVRAEVIAALVENAARNAWLDGYHNISLLASNLRQERSYTEQQARFFGEFSREFAEAIQADPYIAVYYLWDLADGRSADDPYRNAKFEYGLKQIEFLPSRVPAYLLMVKLHAHSFYYVFTTQPEQVFGGAKKRWGYLADVNFDQVGWSFREPRYDSACQVMREAQRLSRPSLWLNSPGFEPEIGGFAERVIRPEESIAYSSRELVRQIVLRNQLQLDPR